MDLSPQNPIVSLKQYNVNARARCILFSTGFTASLLIYGLWEKYLNAPYIWIMYF